MKLPRIVSLSTVMLLATLLGGCNGGAPESSPEIIPAPPSVPATESGHDRDGLPPQFDGVEEKIDYYIARLPDRRFVDTYGGKEHPRPWYIAAEQLGQIGQPAIPQLVSRLDTPDEYELMLALYALMLASQDPPLMTATGGDYVELGTVLDPRHNADNRARALAWWQRHGWRWDRSP